MGKGENAQLIRKDPNLKFIWRTKEAKSITDLKHKISKAGIYD